MAFLIYGANGYTGELIAREAVRRGQKPILAGRNVDKLATLANELLRDAGYRRWLRDDPSTALSVFDAGPAARPQRNITYERATVRAAA